MKLIVAPPVHNAALQGVFQAIFHNTFHFALQRRVVDGSDDFDAVVEVSWHPVGRTDKYFFFLASVGKDKDARVLEVAVDNTAYVDVIAYALKKCEIKDKKRAVMVGDREHDIIGAKINGLSSIGVLYGYGSKEELLEAGANYIANSPVDILHYILG